MRTQLALIAICIAASGPAFANETINEGHLASMDTDGDGAVSKSEYSAFSDFAFKTMDIDGNTALTLDEASPHMSARDFKALDADGNGQISSGELSQQMMQDFDTADKDNDGFLN